MQRGVKGGQDSMDGSSLPGCVLRGLVATLELHVETGRAGEEVEKVGKRRRKRLGETGGGA
jgi:hypothetical protein